MNKPVHLTTLTGNGTDRHERALRALAQPTRAAAEKVLLNAGFTQPEVNAVMEHFQGGADA